MLTTLARSGDAREAVVIVRCCDSAIVPGTRDEKTKGGQAGGDDGGSILEKRVELELDHIDHTRGWVAENEAQDAEDDRHQREEEDDDEYTFLTRGGA
jgi:hypothetical protein